MDNYGESLDSEKQKLYEANLRLEKEEREYRFRDSRNILTETMIWLTIGFGFLFYPVIIFVSEGSQGSIPKLYLENLGSVSLGIFFMIFPIIFRLILRSPPLDLCEIRSYTKIFYIIPIVHSGLFH